MRDKMSFFEACHCCMKQSCVLSSTCFLRCIELQCPQHSRQHICCNGDAAEYQHAAWPLCLKCCCTAVSVLLQEIGTKQQELNSSQREVRKTQQLLRQLERQLAKSHNSRKEAASVSQQMQVGIGKLLHQRISSVLLSLA